MKKTGLVLMAVGAIFVIATILWMTVGVGALSKLPTGMDETAYYSGEATWYINPATQEVLPAGRELTAPLSVERKAPHDVPAKI